MREKLDQALAEAAHFRQQAAVERERADVLQWEALGRINALTATIGEAVGSPERDYTDDQDAGAEAAKPAAPGARRDFWERLSRQLRGKPEEER